MEPTKNLSESLLSFQGLNLPIRKGSTASTGGRSYTYANLADILNTVRGPLTERGLLLSQTIVRNGEWTEVVSELVHCSTGEKVTSSIPLAIDPDPKTLGSRITYYRRYQILILLGLCPDAEDDDGGTASDASRPRWGDKPGERESYRQKRDDRQQQQPRRNDDRRDDRSDDQPAGRDEPSGPDCPTCGESMRRSKFRDKQTGEYGHYCPNWKNH